MLKSDILVKIKSGGILFIFEKVFGAIGIIGKIIKWILLVVFLGLGIFLLIFSIIVLTRGDDWSGLNNPEKVGTIFALVIGVILLYLAAWLIKSLIFSKLRFKRNVKKYNEKQSKIPNDNDFFEKVILEKKYNLNFLIFICLGNLEQANSITQTLLLSHNPR